MYAVKILTPHLTRLVTFAMIFSMLFIASICSDDKIYVVTDIGRDSKCLISDINRVWIDRSRNEPSEISYQMMDIQCRLSQNLVLIDYYDRKACEQYRIPRLSSYPRYRIGEYRDFLEFDKRAFSSAGYPTMTIFAIINNHNADEYKWKKACEEISRDDARRYLCEILIWGDMNKIPEVQSITSHFEDDETTIIESIKERYSGNKSFPMYRKTKHPDSPFIGFPYK